MDFLGKMGRDKKIHVGIKPISVNKCWQGRRFKSKEYKLFEEEMLYRLPKYEIPEGDLEIHYIFGVSNKLMDIDNSVKPIQDILQKKYDFNDNRVMYITIHKMIVSKGSEFVEFEIVNY